MLGGVITIIIGEEKGVELILNTGIVMMNSSDPVSPISLNQLPQPYDISAAVQQALSLNSPSDVGMCQPTMERSLFEDNDIYIPPLTDQSSCNPIENEIEDLLPDLVSEDLLDDVWDNVTLPDIDIGMEGENAANMEELEQFVKYIDGEDESNEKEEIQQSRKLRCTRKHLMPSPHYLTWKMKLQNLELWKGFFAIGNEMIITKNGRRMFPAIIISVDGLCPDSYYSICLDIFPADDRRYKFMQTDWLPVGKIDKKITYTSYVHPESPNTGLYWMEKPISFKFVKLTNNQATPVTDQVILNSMQKYIPSVRITCESPKENQVTQSFQFPDTAFIAVTAYQNNKITQMKINNNPYARAFRDSSPSEADGEAAKDGGQFSNSTKEVSPPQHQAQQPTVSGVSNTSEESGFGSSNGLEALYPNNWIPVIPPNPQPLESPYGCPLNFWADENSLYNSSLVYPPPLLDETESFSEPYLHQTSQMYLEAQEVIISPIKLPECPELDDPPRHGGYREDDVFM